MKLDKTKHIILFENCQITKGYSRSLLVDFQRRKLEFIDNEISDILLLSSRKYSINEIIKPFAIKEKNIILEYFNFLLREEYAFLCTKEEVNFFTKIDLSWDYPAEITNCIIDFDKEPDDIKPYLDLFGDLDKLGCENIQIRDYSGLPIKFYKSFLTHINKTIIHKIEILHKYIGKINIYMSLLKEYPRITELTLHSAPVKSYDKINITQSIRQIKQIITDNSDCGVISPNYINLRLEHFLESNNYNTCLNRKVSIDVNGSIKNCPSMNTSFGNISNTSIIDVIKQDKFTILWDIKKDDINICKECEFRHICTDCRAFLGKDINYEKPFKCNYNPHDIV